MTTNLPRYYFRTRDNGAHVFRVDAENRQRRIDMDQIATVNIRNGDIRPQGDRILTEDDKAAIAEWIENRKKQLQKREVDDILRTVDHLNQTAHWVQTRANDRQLDRVTDALLLAMHDLRSVLIRRKAGRVEKED
jgi:putative ribosome biogenesis GTPase RsgA